jgi:hypothetical protein
VINERKPSDFNALLRRGTRRSRAGNTFEAPIFDDNAKENEQFDADLRRRVTGKQFEINEREGTDAEQRAADHMNAAIRGALPRRDEDDDTAEDGAPPAPDYGGGVRGAASAEDRQAAVNAQMNEMFRSAWEQKRDGRYEPATRRKQEDQE